MAYSISLVLHLYGRLWYTKEPLFLKSVQHNFDKQDEQAETTHPKRSSHFAVTGQRADVQRDGGYAKRKHQHHKKTL